MRLPLLEVSQTINGPIVSAGREKCLKNACRFWNSDITIIGKLWAQAAHSIGALHIQSYTFEGQLLIFYWPFVRACSACALDQCKDDVLLLEKVIFAISKLWVQRSRQMLTKSSTIILKTALLGIPLAMNWKPSFWGYLFLILILNSVNAYLYKMLRWLTCIGEEENGLL